MASHTVALSTAAYEALRHRKRAEESFTDVVLRLARDDQYKALEELAGSLSDTEAARVAEKVEDSRRRLVRADRRRYRKSPPWGTS